MKFREDLSWEPDKFGFKTEIPLFITSLDSVLFCFVFNLK